MNLHFFGGVFRDTLIYTNETHNSEVYDLFGGSAFNMASIAVNFFDNVFLHSSIGTDWSVSFKKENQRIRTDFLTVSERLKTARFISVNNEVLAVERKILDQHIIDRLFNIDFESDVAVLTTELCKKSIQTVLSKKWFKLFIDAGPRPYLIDAKDTENAFVLGNRKEATVVRCDIIKCGHNGAIYKDLIFPSDDIIYKYPIGCGDIFDAIFICAVLKGIPYDQAVRNAVNVASICSSVPEKNKLLPDIL
ncbi:MAG TPA: carbohydrate kinase family protein [Petrotogaceae bacterium]|mgnify:FL=1|nr:carbohydrate kinase family protein [Petrotogaceae bacterium]